MDSRIILIEVIVAFVLYLEQCDAYEELATAKRTHYRDDFKRERMRSIMHKRGDSKWCEDPREFECATDDECTDIAYVCDGEEDCKDGSDEQGCDAYTCNPNMQFACNSGSPTCVLLSDVCNDDDNCQDGSDESDCLEYFDCKDEINEDLVSPDSVCDGSKDCTNGNDEDKQMCKDYTCNKAQYKCRDGSCTLRSYRCDWQTDCPQGDDEQDCDIF